MPGLIPDATGQPAGGGSMADPFRMINSLMDFQNKANANRKFQAEFMANSALGEIVAHAPSLEEGARQAMANPLIAGFGQEGLTSLKNQIMMGSQTSRLQQETAAGRQAMNNSGYDAAIQSSTEAMNDPLNYNKYFDAGLQGVDPSVRDSVAARVNAVRQGIGAKIKGFDMSDPAQLEQAKNAVKAAFVGAYAGANGDPGRLTPFMPDVRIEGGYPMQFPSAVERMQGKIPSIVPSGTAPAATPAQPSAAGPANPATGQPMDVTPNTSKFLSQAGPDVYGNVHFPNPGAQQAEDDYQKSYAGPERDQFNGAKNTKSIIAQMNTALDDIVKTNQFYEPGAASGLRGEIGKLKELFYAATGKQPTGLDKFLPNVNADVQIINKMYSQLTSAQAQQTEGTGRKALGVLEMASHAVPGMENTPLGFKVLSAGLDSVADFSIARYNYKSQWRQQPGSFGTLTGADQKFNDQVSPEDLVRKELAKFGMTLTKDGSMSFENDDQLNRAFTSGLMGKVGSQVRKDNYDHFYNILHPSK